MKNFFLFRKIKGYRRAYDMLYSLRRYKEIEIAQQRMKIIKFYEEYGKSATKEAFGADMKVISLWRQRLREEGYKGLIPYSTRPHHIRTSNIPSDIIKFIKELREKQPRIGKEKIKVFLDSFCKEKGT
jgi:hypothetical protein